MSSLLINDLVIYKDETPLVNLLEDIKQPLKIEKSLALVGQSGSGKSLTIKTILNLLPSELNSKFSFDSDFELNYTNIGFIPQNPFTSLSPMTKISKQFFLDDEKIDKYLNAVGLETNLKNRFPVQLSGGQLQRVVIAIALSKEPKLLLLDEPTTALDSQTKETILTLIDDLQKQFSFKMIFVSHDIDSIKDICDNIAILKNGKVCEYGNTLEVIENPKTDYTKELISSTFSNREYRQ